MSIQKNTGIDALKALGAVLIINSHLEGLYPKPFMAADGMMGNSLFFLTTGATLAGSLERRPEESLTAFTGKRLLRLFPGLWLVMLILPPLDIDWGTLRGVFTAFCYPTFFTFVGTILPLYPIYFFINRLLFLKNHPWIIASLLIISALIIAIRIEWAAETSGVAWSNLGRLSWTLHFFAAMVIGGTIAESEIKAASDDIAKPLIRFGVLTTSYVVLRILALPAVAVRAGQMSDIVALLGMPVCIAVCYNGLLLLNTPTVSRWLRKTSVSMVVGFLAMNSWETYLIHGGIARIPIVANLVFPLNVAMVFAITLLLAPLFRRLVNSPFPKRNNKHPNLKLDS